MDVLDVIRLADPEDPRLIQAYETDLLAELREATSLRILADTDTDSGPVTPSTSFLSGRRRLLRPLAVAAALAATAFVLSVVPGSDSTPPADALDRLAAAAEAVPDTPLGPGQYRYRHTVGVVANYTIDCETCPAVVEFEDDDIETWVSADGTVRTLERGGPPEADVWAPGRGEPEWRSWPQQPDELWAKLSAIASQHGDFGQQVHAWASDALADPGTPPGVRAAIFRALRGAPGIEVEELVNDHMGRSVIGIAHTSDGFTTRLVFDPASGAYTGQEYSDGSWTAIVVEAVVDGPDVRPAG